MLEGSMLRKGPAISSIGLVLAVALVVFASASFATEGLVAQQSDLLTDEVKPMSDLRTRGSVRAVQRSGAEAYKLAFTATFTPGLVDEEHLADQQVELPDLFMRQSISYPTLSDAQEFVGPVGLPFASETLALDVVMDGACFEPQGRDGYRLKHFDPKCTQAYLSLGDQRFEVTELFRELDTTVKQVGRDNRTWMWSARATFEDPGYPFPIVSLGQGGTTEVRIGNLGGAANVGRVNFDGSN